MPVRGTTQWKHAILHKKIINHDRGGTYVMCAWDTCEKPGYEMYKCVEHEGKPGYEIHDIVYVFCTERHKQYFVHSTVRANNLPAGYRSSII